MAVQKSTYQNKKSVSHPESRLLRSVVLPGRLDGLDGEVFQLNPTVTE